MEDDTSRLSAKIDRPMMLTAVCKSNVQKRMKYKTNERRKRKKEKKILNGNSKLLEASSNVCRV